MRATPNTVRRHREQRQWTLAVLAQIVGCGEPHLSKIERGLVRPIGITQERIANALGIDRDVLFPEPIEQEISA